MKSEMSDTRGLQIIFAFFLGLMVTSFVGVGVYTFYPNPDGPFRDRLRPIERQEQEIRLSKASDALTPDDRAKMQKLQNEIDDIQDQLQAASAIWGRHTSIILIALATLVMGISLIRAFELLVISNGLLLGGVFTMVYGVGWMIATDTSKARFFTLTVALAITLGFGYIRFVRRRLDAPSPTVIGFSSEDASDLERRVRLLENRISKAADVLGDGDQQGGKTSPHR